MLSQLSRFSVVISLNLVCFFRYCTVVFILFSIFYIASFMVFGICSWLRWRWNLQYSSKMCFTIICLLQASQPYGFVFYKNERICESLVCLILSLISTDHFFMVANFFLVLVSSLTSRRLILVVCFHTLFQNS